jgi:asparagine N-glycosylation enzyme membrane subunit Stt3
MAMNLKSVSSGNKGLLAGLVILAVLGAALLMFHFTLFGAGFTILYIAIVALIAEYINKHHHPGDIVMAAVVLLAAGIYLLTLNYFHVYDLTSFISTTIIAAVVWTVVTEPIAVMFRKTHGEVRHYVREED